MPDVGYWISIRQHPARKDDQMNADEGEATGEGGYGVAKPLERCSSHQEFLLVLRNQINVFLHVAVRHFVILFGYFWFDSWLDA